MLSKDHWWQKRCRTSTSGDKTDWWKYGKSAERGDDYNSGLRRYSQGDQPDYAPLIQHRIHHHHDHYLCVTKKLESWITRHQTKKRRPQYLHQLGYLSLHWLCWSLNFWCLGELIAVTLFSQQESLGHFSFVRQLMTSSAAHLWVAKSCQRLMNCWWCSILEPCYIPHSVQ